MSTFKVSLHGTNDFFVCDENTTLLSAMEKSNSKLIKIGCRGGGCGLCKIKIIDGNYQTKKMSRKHITEEEESQRYALACRTLPKSELTFIIDQ